MLVRWAASRVGDPWIDNGVQKVGEQLAGKRQNRKHEREPHDDRIVAVGDRVEKQPAHSGPTENLLKDDRAAEIPVILGERIGNLVEIKEGLKEGDKVIGKIDENIRAGSKISIKSK